MDTIRDIITKHKVIYYSIEIINEDNCSLGILYPNDLETDMALNPINMKVRSGNWQLSGDKKHIKFKVFELDNMRFIKLIYRLIAEKKYLLWEERKSYNGYNN